MLAHGFSDPFPVNLDLQNVFLGNLNLLRVMIEIAVRSTESSSLSYPTLSTKLDFSSHERLFLKESVSTGCIVGYLCVCMNRLLAKHAQV